MLFQPVLGVGRAASASLDGTGAGRTASERNGCVAMPAAVLPQRDSAAEGAGGVVAAKSRSVVRYGGRSAFLLYQDIVKQRITPPPKTLSLSGEGNAVEVRMKSGYAR